MRPPRVMATTANPTPNMHDPDCRAHRPQRGSRKQQHERSQRECDQRSNDVLRTTWPGTQGAPQRSKPHNHEHRTDHGPRRTRRLRIEHDERYPSGGKGDRASPDSEPRRFPGACAARPRRQEGAEQPPRASANHSVRSAPSRIRTPADAIIVPSMTWLRDCSVSRSAEFTRRSYPHHGRRSARGQRAKA